MKWSMEEFRFGKIYGMNKAFNCLNSQMFMVIEEIKREVSGCCLSWSKEFLETDFIRKMTDGQTFFLWFFDMVYQ